MPSPRLFPLTKALCGSCNLVRTHTQAVLDTHDFIPCSQQLINRPTTQSPVPFSEFYSICPDFPLNMASHPMEKRPSKQFVHNLSLAVQQNLPRHYRKKHQQDPRKSTYNCDNPQCRLLLLFNPYQTICGCNLCEFCAAQLKKAFQEAPEKRQPCPGESKRCPQHGLIASNLWEDKGKRRDVQNLCISCPGKCQIDTFTLKEIVPHLLTSTSQDSSPLSVLCPRKCSSSNMSQQATISGCKRLSDSHDDPDSPAGKKLRYHRAYSDRTCKQSSAPPDESDYSPPSCKRRHDNDIVQSPESSGLSVKKIKLLSHQQSLVCPGLNSANSSSTDAPSTPIWIQGHSRVCPLGVSDLASALPDKRESHPSADKSETSTKLLSNDLDEPKT